MKCEMLRQLKLALSLMIAMSASQIPARLAASANDREQHTVLALNGRSRDELLKVLKAISASNRAEELRKAAEAKQKQLELAAQQGEIEAKYSSVFQQLRALSSASFSNCSDNVMQAFDRRSGKFIQLFSEQPLMTTTELTLVQRSINRDEVNLLNGGAIDFILVTATTKIIGPIKYAYDGVSYFRLDPSSSQDFLSSSYTAEISETPAQPGRAEPTNTKVAIIEGKAQNLPQLSSQQIQTRSDVGRETDASTKNQLAQEEVVKAICQPRELLSSLNNNEEAKSYSSQQYFKVLRDQPIKSEAVRRVSYAQWLAALDVGRLISKDTKLSDLGKSLQLHLKISITEEGRVSSCEDDSGPSATKLPTLIDAVCRAATFGVRYQPAVNWYGQPTASTALEWISIRLAP